MTGFPQRGTQVATFAIAGTVLSALAAHPFLHSRAASRQNSTATSTASSRTKTDDAFRLNNLGVAYMNQQKFAEAEKYFEQALAADPKLSIARLNLGISLMSQQQ